MGSDPIHRQRLGPYELIAILGSGGMGEVHRARDTRLSREVAVKLLPKALVADETRLRRFEQEARTLAALNDPNILVIHDTGVHEGTPYLVSELLEGETLREILRARAALPVRTALEYALQIAHGLTAAHARGVVHRDLKPENVFVTNQGRVKILDFGLARLSEVSGASSGPKTQPEALTVQATEPGMVMGTPSYMSPEQVRAEPADHRADIFAFGCLLYEMLSGERAFKRETSAEVMAAILTTEPPDLGAKQPSLSPALQRVVHRCLEKKPDRRFQSASDLAFALENISSTSTAATGLPAAGAVRPLAWRAGLVGTLILLLGWIWATGAWRKEAAPPQPVSRLSVLLPDNCQVRSLALSPNGRYLACSVYSSNSLSLMIRDLAGWEMRTVPESVEADKPFWSPDSRSIGFFAENKLKVVPVEGGRPRILCDARGAGGTWGRTGRIVYSEYWGTGLFQVSVEGGEPQPLTRLNSAEREGAHLWPEFLPDGEHFLYIVRSGQPDRSVIWLGGLAPNAPRQPLMPADALVAYTAPGQLLFAREGGLCARRFDLRKMAFSGDTVTVVDRVAYDAADSKARASSSLNGVLVYTTAVCPSGQLTWLDRKGLPVATVGPASAPVRAFSISPDEKSLAEGRFDPRTGSWNIWRIDLASGTEERITTVRNANRPVWTADGSAILCQSDALTIFDLYRRPLDRSKPEQLLFRSDNDKNPTDCSANGDVLFSEFAPKTKWDIWTLSLSDPARPQPFLQSEASEQNARFSPDGHWVAYSSDETGRFEVYIQAFPSGNVRLRVSHEGGLVPMWSLTGKELFFVSPDATLFSAEIRTAGSAVTADAPKPLFRIAGYSSSAADRYIVSSDSQRFLFNILPPEATTSRISVVLNWSAELPR